MFELVVSTCVSWAVLGAQTAESAASHLGICGTELLLLGTPWVSHWRARAFWFSAYSHYCNNWIRIPLFSQAGGTQHPGKWSVWFSWSSLWLLKPFVNKSVQYSMVCKSLSLVGCLQKGKGIISPSPFLMDFAYVEGKIPWCCKCTVPV